ncbi:MAG: hypothetical protein V7K92_13605 [Nostoc sp.]|uniref:hypothetical protein n=1 Tax=Nostoc sp. TaxID=1180 RepID=UPI002FF13087
METTVVHLYKIQIRTYALYKKTQPQLTPGLAQKMNPQPDHGEENYTGCGKLANRKALITGGDSGIGRAERSVSSNRNDTIALSSLSPEKKQ